MKNTIGRSIWIALALLSGVLIGCTKSESSREAKDTDLAGKANLGLPCETCIELVDIDGTSMRALVLNPKSRELPLLVDLGGPGLDVAEGNLSLESLPAWMRTHPLVFIREKWAGTKEKSPLGECAMVLQKTLAAYRDGDTQEVGACGKDEVLHWTPRDLARGVTAVCRRFGDVGLVGVSFGTWRLSGAASGSKCGSRLVWSALYDPGPPPGADISQSQVLTLNLGLERPCSDAGSCRELGERLSLQAPLAVPGRARMLTPNEVAIGLLRLAFESGDKLRATLVAATAPEPEVGLRALGIAADEATGRYGENDTAAATAAYVAGICEAYPVTGDIASKDSGPLERSVADFWSSCDALRAPGTAFEVPASADHPTCLFLNSGDLSVDAEAVRRALPKADVTAESYGPGHGDAFASGATDDPRCDPSLQRHGGS